MTQIPYEIVNRLRRQLLIARTHEERKKNADDQEAIEAAERALRAQRLIMDQIRSELKERYMTDEGIAGLFERENARTTTELKWLTAER